MEDYDIFGRSLEFDHVFDEDKDIVDLLTEDQDEVHNNISTAASSTIIPIFTVQVQN